MKLFVHPLLFNTFFNNLKTVDYRGFNFSRGENYVIENIKPNFQNHWAFHSNLTNNCLQIQVDKMIHREGKIALN